MDQASSKDWRGFTIIVVIAALSKILAEELLPEIWAASKNAVSPITTAVVLGLLLRNIFWKNIPKRIDADIKDYSRTCLRIGVILLGLRLSLAGVGEIGLQALPVVLICMAAALGLVTVIGRQLGLSPRLAMLIAVGTSVCGVTAIVATAPVIEAEETETSYAVGCITIFGIFALLVYPFLVTPLFGDHLTAIGIFLGSAIHDTSQVTGAAMMVRDMLGKPEILDIATVTKLLRNLSMAVLIPAMAFKFRAGNKKKVAISWNQVIPTFVVIFVGMVILRTILDWALPQFAPDAVPLFKIILKIADFSVGVFLAIAMAGIGASTVLTQLSKLGLKPLGLALFAATTVGVASYAALKLFGIH